MTDQLQPGSPKEPSIWKQALPNLLGTIGGAGIIGVAGVLYAVISGMDFSDVLLYILLPVAVLLVLGAGVLAVRSIQQLLQRNYEWQDLIERAILEAGARVENVECHLQRLALAVVIAQAEGRSWTVEDAGEDDEHSLFFTSPDGGTVGMFLYEVDPRDVARQLGEFDPHHFDEDWQPPARESELQALSKAVDEVRQQTRSLDKSIQDATGSLRLDSIVAVIEVLRSEGWTPRWNEKQRTVTLSKGTRINAFQVADTTAVAILRWARTVD
jgi:hypothetical protein